MEKVDSAGPFERVTCGLYKVIVGEWWNTHLGKAYPGKEFRECIYKWLNEGLSLNDDKEIEEVLENIQGIRNALHYIKFETDVRKFMDTKIKGE